MLLTPDRLRPTVRSQSRRALDTGALVPISTSAHVIEEQGLTFAVRRVERVARKEAAGQTGTQYGGSGDHTGDPFAHAVAPMPDGWRDTPDRSAGALLVRDAAMHRRLQEIGPLRVLAAVSKG